MKKRLFTLLLMVTAMLFTLSCSLYEHDFTPAGTRRALIYGMADYTANSFVNEVDGRTYIFSDLTNTKLDADDMTLFFQQYYGFDEVTKQLDVTKEKILADFNDMKGKTQENDITLFYFSGHGIGYSIDSLGMLIDPVISPPESSFGESAIVPNFPESLTPGKDHSVTNEDFIYMTELFDALDAIPGKQVVIIDICNGGGLIPENSADIDRLPGEYDNNSDVSGFSEAWNRYFSDLENSYEDIWIITSSGAYEESWENNSIQNGFYTYYFLDSLGYDHENNTVNDMIPADLNGDGYVTMTEAYSRTFNTFEWEYNVKYDTEPYYSHISGGAEDLILIDLH